MAMTKKEKEAHEALLRQVRILGALRFTDKVLPDVPHPKNGDYNALTKGFLFNSHSICIAPACSSSTGHNSWNNQATSSQGARDLYSTRLLALKAMRNEIEQESAKRLADIDAMIEDEKNQVNKGI